MKTYLLLLLLFAGCYPRQEVIRTDTVRVPYTLTDTLELFRVDTVWTGMSERVIIKVDTVWKRAWVRVMDTVKVIDVDTLTQIIERKVEPSDWEVFKRSWWAIASALLLGIVATMFWVLVVKLGKVA